VHILSVLRPEKAKKAKKNNIKAKQKSLLPNSPKKAKKEPKSQTKNFKAKNDQKRPNLTYLALRKAKWQSWYTSCGAQSVVNSKEINAAEIR